MAKTRIAIVSLLIGILCVMAFLWFISSDRNTFKGNITHSFKTATEEVASAIDGQRAKEARAARAERKAKEAKQNREDKPNNRSKVDSAITEDFHDDFIHGEKGSAYQKYIMLHDTEGTASASSVVQSWLNQGKGIAAHFVVNKDGTIVQCVPMDKIAHHAGFGNAGHNKKYGVTDESRDDKVGTQSIGSEYPDYGMNSYSIGIEMVHGGDGDDYPEAQLEALDKLIAYINEYYGTRSEILDHKMWRSTNSDTSPEFATYLSNYISYGSHTGKEEN